MGGEVQIGESKLDIGIAVKGWQIEQNFVLPGIGKSWVGFRLAQLPTPYLSPNSPNPPNWGSSKTIASNYSQTIADGATL